MQSLWRQQEGSRAKGTSAELYRLTSCRLTRNTALLLDAAAHSYGGPQFSYREIEVKLSFFRYGNGGKMIANKTVGHRQPEKYRASGHCPPVETRLQCL